VAIKNGPIARLFEPILTLYGIPHYYDIDTTVFFAPFFALFAGLCIGDVAYGLILLSLSIVALLKASKSVKGFAAIGVILGIATCFCGVLLNSCFGHQLFGSPSHPEVKAFIPWGREYFSFFTPQQTDRGTVFPMMSFALLVGYVQVMLAYILNMRQKITTGGIKAGIAPLSFILIFFGALVWAAHTDFLNLGIGTFHIEALEIGIILLMVPQIIGKTLVFGGIACFALFANNEKKLGARVFQSGLDFYNTVTGIFGNILSYLRLFALGIASGMLGSVFNQIAFMVVTDKSGVIHYASPFIVCTILILIVGHTLNFGLSMIGAFAHPLRLTFVEFLQNCNFRWGGKPYKPLTKVNESGI
jgi:V/A-type H+-transporting ATPase subunit I